MTELSSKLKETRLSLGMSLDDLQTITKIQRRYLVAIEDGDFSIMPGPFYVRAFIKQYAEAVHLDPDELFEQYRSEIPSSHSDDFPEKLSRVQSRKTAPMASSKIFDVLPKVVIGLFVIGTIVFLYTLVVQNNENNTANEAVEAKKDTVTYTDGIEEKEQEKEAAEDTKSQSQSTDATTETEAEQETPAVVPQVTVVETKGKATVYELKNAPKFELKLVSTGETWVSIKNGKGTSFFQGMLRKGAEENKIVDFTNEQEAVIVVGNSTATEIYINDQKVEYATSPSEQVRQDITIRYVREQASQ